MREEQMYTVTEVNRDPKKSKGSFLAVNPGMLKGEEGLHWLDANQLDTISGEFQAVTVRNMAWKDANAWEERQKYWENWMQKKKRVHLLALGDVGSTVLIGLKLLGAEGNGN